MVVSWPSAVSPVDDEDSVLLSHPIHDLLNDISWENDDYTSSPSEDDDLQKEIDVLSSAERRVSQEISDLARLFSSQPESKRERTTAESGPKKLQPTISDLVRLFSNQPEKERERTTAEIGPKKLQPTISDLVRLFNEVHIELTKRKNRFVVQKQILTPNQDTKRWGKRTKKRINNPDIHEVDITMFTRDGRESPGQSQPSDENSNGMFGVCTREPPEEIQFVEEDEIHNASTDLGENESTPEPEEKTFLQYREGSYEPSFIGQLEVEENFCILTNEEEEEFRILSEWCQRSRQLSDLEKGESHLFEEELFWEECFWKTPVCESASQNPSSNVQRERLPTSELSGIGKLPRVSKSRQETIDVLLLPTLDRKRDEIQNHEAEVDCQSIESRREESDGGYIDESEQSDVLKNTTKSRERIIPKSFQRKSSQVLPFWNDNRIASCTQSRVSSYSNTLRVTVSNEADGMFAMDEEMTNEWSSLCHWRTVVLIVHVLLAIIGGAVFIIFL